MNFFRVGVMLCAVVLIAASASGGESRFFPATAFGQNLDSNQEWIALYSKYLEGFNEPSLFERSRSSSSQSYRFLWLRSFHRPVSVRLDVDNDGIGQLMVKLGSRPGVAYARGPVQKHVRHLTKQQTDSFLSEVDRLGFWQLAPEEEPVAGPDGARWILEGARDGQYHVVHRWTPKDGVVRTLGLNLALNLGKLKIPAEEIY